MQAELYGDDRAFTAFHTVEPQTALRVLNLNWRESDLPPAGALLLPQAPPHGGDLTAVPGPHRLPRAAPLRLRTAGPAGTREKEIGRPEKGNGAQAAREYHEGIRAVFANVARSLESGGHVVIVVHDRGEMYFEMARELGFAVEAVLERHVNRRTGRRSGEFFERVYVWRKE